MLIEDITEESVGVQISAPPVDGEANVELVKFISDTGSQKVWCGIRKGSHEILQIILVIFCFILAAYIVCFV